MFPDAKNLPSSSLGLVSLNKMFRLAVEGPGDVLARACDSFAGGRGPAFRNGCHRPSL